MNGTHGRYLFAIARDLNATDLTVSGLRGAPLQVVEHDGLQAVVCDVDLDEFGEDSLAEHLEDMAWLEEVARTHNDVVFAAAAVATVAPMRLVTICSDDHSVRQRVEDLHDQLTAALDRVHGHREWSVKVFVTGEDPQTPTTGLPAGGRSGSRAAAPDPSAAGGESTGGAGAAYLRRKKAAAEHRRSASQQAAETAEAIHEELGAVAKGARRLPAQDPRLTGRREPMVLNAAYLVSADDGEAFAALVRRVADLHHAASVELDGPWPPYSFATLETR